MKDYKLFVIYSGNEEIKKQDGQIEYIGLKKEYPTHAMAMYDYLKDNFSHVEALKGISNKVDVHTASAFLSQLGMIVFINSTPSDEIHFEKYGYSGMFIMPKQLSEKQLKKLHELKDLDNYKVEINYNVRQVNGVLRGENIRLDSNFSECPLEEYIEIIKGEKNDKRIH